MHQGSCHCGAIRLTLPATPQVATACNCSLCRRQGGPWVYFEFGTVLIEAAPGATEEYVWGDKSLRNVRCRTCGCVTHWEPLQRTPGGKHGVNLGNFDPALIASVRVRRFDGADSWTFIDPAGGLATDAELAATVERMASRLSALEAPPARALMDHYTALCGRFEADLGPTGRDVDLARSGALMLVQAATRE